jgi:hypothetical protein
MSSPFAGTRAATEPWLDLPALEALLRVQIPGFAGPLQAERFNGGQSNPTFQLITPERRYVMRCKPGPVAQLLPTAHAIEREARVLRALHGSAVPVPEVLLLHEDEALLGRAFYVMEMLDGEVHWDPRLKTHRQRAAHGDLRGHERHHRRHPQRRPRCRRPARLRRARQLLRPGPGSLDQAVPRGGVQGAADRRHGAADRVAAGQRAAARLGADAPAARRLPARQPGVRARHSARAGRARLGAVDPGRPAWPISPTTRWPGCGRPVEPVPARVEIRRGPDQPRIRSAVRNHGPLACGARGLQLLGARHRQHGDRWCATAPRSSRKRWLLPLLDGRSARPSP